MGRIKTKLIKRTVHKLIEMHADMFRKDFMENKQLIQNVADIPSKKLRNVMAGYLTRLTKKTKNVS